jgi:hypothetical protein
MKKISILVGGNAGDGRISERLPQTEGREFQSRLDANNHF